MVILMSKVYMCIDLKSFYASVECTERGLNPLDTNLVVADKERTDKTICLAVSPSLKKHGLSGRSRLFEVVKKVKEINNTRFKNNNNKFIGSSYLDSELSKNKALKLDYIVAPPHMNKYMEVSSTIYNIYLKYLSKDDIHVYSIDEVFCDITNYLKMYKLNPISLTSKIIKDVYDTTGITATAGIGTNMYLAKVAMDILAKHKMPNEIGVRIAVIDEITYRKQLWNHKPITDFWRVGKGISKKLEQYNIYTMGDVARVSLDNEDLLYNLFGINAELLIDHAWGYEPVTMSDIKAYKPKHNSISKGQVLSCAYSYEKVKIIIREMFDALALELMQKKMVTEKLVLDLNYEKDKVKNDSIDRYGRLVPKPSHGTINLDFKTSSSIIIMKKGLELYERIVNKDLLVKRVTVTAALIEDESKQINVQLDMFSNNYINEKDIELQKTILNLKNKYGKNSILKAMNLEEGATMIERNNQIGGHKA